MLTIHENAKKNFVNKTEEILSFFELYNIPKQPEIKSEHYVFATITDKDIIGEIKYHYLINGLGENVGLVTFKKSDRYYINEDNYKKVRILIEQISSLKDIKNYLSVKFIDKLMSDWLVGRFSKEFETSFIDYLLEKAKDSVEEREIWIPIPYTSSIREFKLGQIYFKTVSEKIIKSWFEPKNDNQNKRNEDDKVIFIKKLQEELQGFIAGICNVVAEPEKAKEIAYDEVSKSLSILRLLSPANFHPQLIVGAYEYGWKVYESEKCLLLSDAGKSFRMIERVRDKGLHWTITDNVLQFMQTSPFVKLESLLSNCNKNKFQEDLFNSLLIYSKHTLKRDVSDKIMYVLVSLESILLKNESEPIQQNLSDRIAFIISKDSKIRQYVAKKVKEVYQIRSKFIHHGVPTVEAFDTITEFFNLSWKVFKNIISNVDNFKTKEEFLSEIDNIKYS